MVCAAFAPGGWISSSCIKRCGRNFENVEAKDDTDGLLHLSGAFGIDDGGCGGAGNGHLGFDLIAERIARLELRRQVNSLVVRGREDGQRKQESNLNRDTKTVLERSRQVHQGRT